MKWEYIVNVIDTNDWPDDVGTLDGELNEFNFDKAFRLKREAELGLNIMGSFGFDVATATLINNGKLFIIMKKPISGEPETIDKELKDEFEKELLRKYYK